MLHSVSLLCLYAAGDKSRLLQIRLLREGLSGLGRIPVPQIRPGATELPAPKARDLDSADVSCDHAGLRGWTVLPKKQDTTESSGSLYHPRVLEGVPILIINKILAHPGRQVQHVYFCFFYFLPCFP